MTVTDKYWELTNDNDGFGIRTLTSDGSMHLMTLYTAVDASEDQWAGQEFIFSVDVKYTSLQSKPTYFRVQTRYCGRNTDADDSSLNYIAYSTLTSTTDGATFNTADWIDDEWVRVTAKFTWPDISSMTTSSNYTEGTEYDEYRYAFSIYLSTASSGEELSIRKPKLELGTIATDWSAAPEDTESELTELTSKYAGLTISLDGIETRVTSAESELGTLSETYVSQTDEQYQIVVNNYSALSNTVDELDELVNGTDSSEGLLSTVSAIATYDLESMADATTNVANYFTFSSSGFTIATANSPFSLKLTANQISFYNGSVKEAYISSSGMYIENAIIGSTLQIGNNFQWETDSSGRLNLVKVG